MQIIEGSEPCIILATSGMLTGGPSVEYLRQLAEDSKNSLIFVSYQAEGSLGNSIQKGSEYVHVEDYKGGRNQVYIKLWVSTISGFSGHSDRDQLTNFVRSMRPKPKRIIIDHGESSKCLELASRMHKMFRVETSAPRNLDVLRIR
jgi:predicted metal-dependent RNase